MSAEDFDMAGRADVLTGSEEAAAPGAGTRGKLAVLAPSFGDVVFVSAFVFAIVLGSVLTSGDGDLGRHLRLGSRIIDEGVIPTVDVYSHTMAGGAMVPHEWLAQAAFAAVERWLEFDGIGLLVALVAAVPGWVLFRWLSRRGISVAVAGPLTLLGVAASAIHWAARPHIFTWLFFVAWVLLLEDHRRGLRRRLWWLLPIMVLWANTHGAFIIGFVMLGIYLVGESVEVARSRSALEWRDVQHLGLVSGLVFLAALLSPGGVGAVVNGFAYTQDPFLLAFTNEYNSPDFHNSVFWPFFALVVLAMFVGLRGRPTTQVLVVVAWTFFALYSQRNIPLYVIAVTPVLASALHDRYSSMRVPDAIQARVAEVDDLERWLVGGAVALLVVAVTAAVLLREPGRSPFALEESMFPIAAMAELGEDPPGETVLNQFEWGGYLLFCCWPEVAVFIDGQTDYYGPELTREHEEAIKARPGWEQVLDRNDVDWVLIRPVEPLAQVLAVERGWDLVYEDETAVAFARR